MGINPFVVASIVTSFAFLSNHMLGNVYAEGFAVYATLVFIVDANTWYSIKSKEPDFLDGITTKTMLWPPTPLILIAATLGLVSVGWALRDLFGILG